MRRNVGFASLIAALAGALIAVGCARRRDDRQIAQAVEAQFEKDAVGGGITIRSAAGVVTLSGQVSSDAARLLAARDAAAIHGVTAVIDNLTVAKSASVETEPVPQPGQAAVTNNRRDSRRHARAHRDSEMRQEQQAAPAAPSTPPDQPPEPPQPALPQNSIAAAAPELPPPPPPPPAPVKYTIPAGTLLSVRLIDSLNSATNRVGDTFHATLSTPIREDGEVVVPAGAAVEGRVVDASEAGRYSGRSARRIRWRRKRMTGPAADGARARRKRSAAERRWGPLSERLQVEEEARRSA
jgi:hypothetical protein